MDKVKLHNQLIKHLESKVRMLNESIARIQESRDNEAKSTAGDKHEVGRAMSQIEVDKNLEQLFILQNQLKELLSIDLAKPCEEVRYGSLVQTTETLFYMAGAHGKMIVDQQTCYVISMISPIGKAMAGKRKGESCVFQGKELLVVDVC